MRRRSLFGYACPVGFWESVRIGSNVAEMLNVEPISPQVVTAAEVNYSTAGSGWWWDATNLPVSRAEAMSVPAIARARNIMCGTVGTLGLERYSDMTGKHLSSIPLYYQPDPASPRSVAATASQSGAQKRPSSEVSSRNREQASGTEASTSWTR